MDSNFLESLPDSIQESLSANNQDEEELIEKLFRADTSQEKNKELLKTIKSQVDILSKRLNGLNPESNVRDPLPRFGDAFFSTVQSSFMPVNIPNMANNYIVDVGDKFNFLLTGIAKGNKVSAYVDRDGSIMISNVGKVQVAGKTLAEAEIAIKKYIEATSLGIIVHTSLAELRDIQVIIMGGVERPGIYTISGGSNILTALNAAGGISENGSYRRVEHRRGSDTLKTIDLYDMLIFGKNFLIDTLRSGDSLYVSPASFMVPVSGGVNFSATYEALPTESAKDLILFAGNFSEGFYGYSQVSISRSNLSTHTIVEIPVLDLDSFLMQPRDALLVPTYRSNREAQPVVNISGSVNRPGDYFISEGETLSSLIKRAGGYKENAYSFGGALFRPSAVEIETKFARLNYYDSVNWIIGNLGRPGVYIDDSAIALLSEEANSRIIEGRVIASFDINEISNDPSKDTLLAGNDRIIIPALDKAVYLFGDFNSSTNLPYDPEMNLLDYIDVAGGVKDSAAKTILLISPDGTAELHSTKRPLFGKRDRQLIYPGSIIYAPREIGQLNGLSYASAMSPILSSLAISLASLNSISK